MSVASYCKAAFHVVLGRLSVLETWGADSGAAGGARPRVGRVIEDPERARAVVLFAAALGSDDAAHRIARAVAESGDGTDELMRAANLFVAADAIESRLAAVRACIHEAWVRGGASWSELLDKPELYDLSEEISRALRYTGRDLRLAPLAASDDPWGELRCWPERIRHLAEARLRSTTTPRTPPPPPPPSFRADCAPPTRRRNAPCGTRIGVEDERAAEALSRAADCVACMDAPRRVVFQCGHLVLCERCAVRVSACPACREPIRTRTLVYDP